jgi:hypothetical protein
LAFLKQISYRFQRQAYDQRWQLDHLFEKIGDVARKQIEHAHQYKQEPISLKRIFKAIDQN